MSDSDLDQVEAAYEAYLEARGKGTDGEAGERAAEILAALPGLLGELRILRAERDRVARLPVEDTYCVAIGGGRHPEDCLGKIITRDGARARALAEQINGGDPDGPAVLYGRAVRAPWVDLQVLGKRPAAGEAGHA